MNNLTKSISATIVSLIGLKKQLEEVEDLEWRGMWTVSTGHISEQDSRILEDISENESHPLCNRVLKYEYGFVIRRLIPHASYREFKDIGLSDSAMDLISKAMEMGFEVLELDGDGPVVEGLPLFDW